jgi:hypothetical protein
MAMVLVCHFVKKRSTVASWSIRVEVFRFPRPNVRHEIVAVRQPDFLLPCDNLRRSPQFHHGRWRKVSRRRLVVIVHMGQAILIEQANLGIVPELKQAFSKTIETASRGLFCIGRQGRAKSIRKSETAPALPAE